MKKGVESISKNYSVARVVQYTAEGIGKAERHIERRNQSYDNRNVDLSRTPLNIHFKDCGKLTYKARLDKLVEAGVVSLRGLKQDAKVFDEMIFDVNTAYFEQRGGYDFARRFYAEVFRFAEQEYGPEHILSAVMHADEQNSALTEQLGHPVYHYHMHVVALPVVEKKILWSKRCKDPALVGTVKSVIHQVSHSKKWASQKVPDEDGTFHIVKSYSLLQDRFFAHMRDTGFEDFERGKLGSTAEHLSVTEFKVRQEQRRLASITAEKQKTLDALAELGEAEQQKTAQLSKLEQMTDAAQNRLNQIVPVVKDAVSFARNHVSTLEQMLPEAGALERARSYREEKALPLICLLKEKLLALYRMVIDLKAKLEALQMKYRQSEQARTHLQADLAEEKEKADLLSIAADDLRCVRRAFGSERIDEVIYMVHSRDEAARLALEQQRVRKRHEQDAR